jgi:hypothetical protein
MREIRKAGFFSQNDNKSSGIDSLLAEIYKCSFDEISTTLYLLFNKIYVSGEYPISWWGGIKVPIFKSGDKEDAKNTGVLH